MRIISNLEQAEALDPVVALGQRAARRFRPGGVRDALSGTAWSLRLPGAGWAAARAPPAPAARSGAGREFALIG
jgi:hypothetical protein